MRKQYGYGYMVFFNMNICRNNLQDIQQLTEFAREHRIATDYHLNETPMLEQDDHFKHLNENPTYIRPEDWRDVDGLIDWIIEKNRAGYQMVNSVPRLQEMKAFMRMSGGHNLQGGLEWRRHRNGRCLTGGNAGCLARSERATTFCGLELPGGREQCDRAH